MTLHDILTRFDGGDTGQTLTTPSATVGTDSYLLAPLAGATGQANPSPTRSLGGAYHNAGNYAAFAAFASGSHSLMVEFGCIAPIGALGTEMMFEIIVADDVGLTTNVNVIAASGVYPKAKFAAASTTNAIPVFVAIPPVNTDLLDGTPLYLGVRFTGGGSGTDHGVFTAKLVDNAGGLAPATFEDGVGYL